MAELDRITLRGVRATGYHGVFDFERREGQEFVIDATLWFSTEQAAISDDVADTVDYGEVAQQIVAIIEGQPYNLIERLAAEIAAELLKNHRIFQVEITVHKPSAPIPVRFADVAVTVFRAE